MGKPGFNPHGSAIRGLTQRPPAFEGGFRRVFPDLPAAVFDDDDLAKLAAKMTAPKEDLPTPETEVDDEENQGIPAGYTYLGQFIDHDLTFDPASSLQQQNDPNALEDFRTPRFDLDCLYGRGPNDQPYLYRDDGLHMLLGRKLSGNGDSQAQDIPRNTPALGERSRALIGDPRNDENVIVSQLQAAMIRFHNRMVDFLAAKLGRVPSFETVQREVRYHYQWVVLHDFLPTISGDAILKVLPHLASGATPFADPPVWTFFNPVLNKGYIPIEFTAAAYRFGHSMVRPIYRLNQTLTARQQIFSPDPANSLAGFRAFPDTWALDWSLFFDMGNNPPQLGINRLQRSYKIDTSLVNPLGNLPPEVASNPNILALRNLLRGRSMGLPSGQMVAAALRETVLSDDEIRVGKATVADTAGNPRLIDISPAFRGNAPLWYYVLAEAQAAFTGDDNSQTVQLGPVGGRLVAETFAGLLWADNFSYLRQNPFWTPQADFLNPDGGFGIADLIRVAVTGVPLASAAHA